MSKVVKERQIACCMTIHQPSWAIFTKLDRVILLARGGVYYDGRPREAIDYFAKMGYAVPEGMNPADYFISITEVAGESEDRTKLIETLIGNWTEYSSKQQVGDDVNEPTKKTVVGYRHQQKVKRRWPTPWFEELLILFSRAARESVSGSAW